LSKIRAFLCTSCLCLALLGSALYASEVAYQGPPLDLSYDGPILVDNSQFLYTNRDFLTFRTEDYLKETAPHLLAVLPAIDTWASQLGIHPRVLVEILRLHSEQHLRRGDREAIDTVVDLASAVAKVFWDLREASPEDSLAASKAVVAAARAFGLAAPEPSAALREERALHRRTAGVPPLLFGYFQPPWEIGDTWAGGGAHGDTGSGVRNALDFWGAFRNWGEDVSEWWVSATQEGTVRVFSTCSVSVVHPNGWRTSTYHLDNVQVADMQIVGRNHQLSNYANNLAQATCQGGSSTGPHVHMAIYYDGERVEIDQSNLDFTAFSHHVGVGQYDSNCTRSWHDHGTQGRICPNFDQLLNDAAPPGDLIFLDGFESGDTSAWAP